MKRIADLWSRRADVFVYFNNDARGYAICDAVTFAELAVASAGRRACPAGKPVKDAPGARPLIASSAA